MRVKRKIFLSVKILICLLVFFLCLFPFFWVIVSSFKSESEVLSLTFTFFPSRWVLDGYRTLLLEDELFLRSTVNSLLVSAVTTIAAIFFNTLCSYTFARTEFPLKKLLWAYIIIPIFVPSIAILVPSYLVVSKLGMVDSYAVLTVPFIFSAYNMFFIRQFYLNIPRSIEEAAMIDGAGKFRIYAQMFLPLSLGPIFLTAVQGFLGLYNGYLWPALTITDKSLYQVMQTLAFYRNERAGVVSIQVVGAVLTAIPTIVIFVAFQKYLIAGVKIAGLK